MLTESHNVSPTKVAMVEDHQIIATGISALLTNCADLEFIGAYRTARELVDTVSDLANTVVLLDLRLGDQSLPRENAELLFARKAKVIAFTSGEDPYLLDSAFTSGIVNVIRKTEPTEVLLETIRQAGNGTLMPDADWAAFVDNNHAFVARELAPQQRTVLQLYASGETADFVARRLGISRNTVNTYIREVRNRYEEAEREASSRVDLYLRAVEDGLLPTPHPSRENDDRMLPD